MTSIILSRVLIPRLGWNVDLILIVFLSVFQLSLQPSSSVPLERGFSFFSSLFSENSDKCTHRLNSFTSTHVTFGILYFLFIYLFFLLKNLWINIIYILLIYFDNVSMNFFLFIYLGYKNSLYSFYDLKVLLNVCLCVCVCVNIYK